MQWVWQPGSWGMCSWPCGLRASCSLTSSTAFCSALWKVQAPQQALVFVPSFVPVLSWIPGAVFRDQAPRLDCLPCICSLTSRAFCSKPRKVQASQQLGLIIIMMDFIGQESRGKSEPDSSLLCFSVDLNFWCHLQIRVQG